MKKWIVRFVSLLVFNVAVLLVIGLLTPARVGWGALWAGIVLTVLVLFVKPLIHRMFASAVAKSSSRRTRVGEWVVQLLVTFAVALLVWIATVVFTSVSVRGFFWGYVLPPVILTIGWAIYAAIDDRVETTAGSLYDRASSAVGNRGRADASAPAPGSVPSITRPSAAPTAAETAGRRELHDGLTDEQRRMLNDL